MENWIGIGIWIVLGMLMGMIMKVLVIQHSSIDITHFSTPHPTPPTHLTYNTQVTLGFGPGRGYATEGGEVKPLDIHTEPPTFFFQAGPSLEII